MKNALFILGIAILAAISNANAQVVSISATDNDAAEGPTDTATFQISRDGGNDGVDLAINVGIDATASDATTADITLNPPIGNIVIPAGSASVIVTLTAVDDFAAETDEDLALEILASPDYTVGLNNQAIAFIEANDFGVTNTNDFDPNIGNPTPAQREGTLRQAIENAQDFGNEETIVFSDDPFTVGPPRTISLTGGELVIFQSMAIQGPGANRVTLEGFDLHRILRVDEPDDPVVVSGLTFLSGAAFTTGPEGRGGAILASGDDVDLTLADCAFVENRAIEGAAVAFLGLDGSLSIERCLFESNRASSEGGAFTFYDGASLTIRDSTFALNESSGRAGAVLLATPDVVAELINVTIVGNRSDENDGGEAGDTGGGLFVESGSCVTHNTLIAGNLRGRSTPADDDIAGNVGAGSSHNLVGDPTTAGGLVDGVLDNVIGKEDEDNPPQRIVRPLNEIVETSGFVNVVPLLEDHGGPTRAVRLRRSSFAVDRGTPAVGISELDQRGFGFPREVPGFPGFSSSQFGSPDIGAIEFDPILVTTDIDEDDGDSDPTIGAGTSLREAIAEANEHPGNDLILFSRGFNGTTDFFDTAAPKTIRLTDQFTVSTSVDIDGPGADLLTIDGDVDMSGTANDGDARLFSFRDPIFVEGTPRSTLNRMTLANGNQWEEGLLESGGAITNGASLTLFEVVLRNNTANNGGAIFNTGILNLLRVEVRDNSVNFGGGGIYNTNDGFFAVQRTTISNNSATNGGGIFINNGTVRLLNTTISENSAADGGGIFYDDGTVTSANSTIAENTASNSTSGGGIHFSGAITSPKLEMDNTIVAANTASSSLIASDIAGGQVAAGSINNLIGDSNSSGGLVDGDNGNIVGDGGGGTIDFSSILEPLADNGGFAPTYLPTPDSLVLDAGDDSSAAFTSGTLLTTDQRDLPRFVGFAVDIGSVEFDGGLLELDPIDDQFIEEGDTLFFTATATDNSGVGGNILFTLEDVPFGSVPDGASIDPDTGDFEWQPEEADGPGFFEFDVVATLEDDSSIVDRQTVFIDVLEVNDSPSIEPVGDRTVGAGMLLTFTADAFDPDLPDNILTLSLDSTSEALGMQIDPGSGQFSWTPTNAGNFPVEITVEDDGDPQGFDSTTFNIEVTAGALPMVSLQTSIGSEILHEPSSFSDDPNALISVPNLILERSDPSGDLTIGLQLENTSTASFAIDYVVNFSTGILDPTQPLTFSGNPLTASLTIPDGERQLVLLIGTTDDTAAEAAESIELSVIPGAAFDIGAGNATVTIAQNDFGVDSLGDFDPTADPNGGEGTLRQAVINARSGLTFPTPFTPKDPITFDSALTGEILLTSGALLLENEDTQIAGPGSDVLMINAGLNSRAFVAHDADLPSGSLDYLISGLRIDSGFTTGNGGGIFNSQVLTLRNCVISNCVANNGGGISNEGELFMERCLISMNAARVYGGGIDNHTGFAYMAESTITANTADFGGGIENKAGIVEFYSCAITGNTAEFSGGGVDTYEVSTRERGDSTTIGNSTVSGNSAAFGAGIFNEQSSVLLVQSTVVDNTASTVGGILTSSNAPAGATALYNTIVAENPGGDLSTDDPAFIDVSQLSEFNLIGDAATAGGLIDGADGNLVGVTSGSIFAPLADNGGPTATHALLPGSPAINAGNNVRGGTTDQRGDGFVRINEDIIDIGAFEVQPEILEAVSCDLSGDAATITWRSTDGQSYDILCSTDLKNWITIATEIPAIGELTSYTDENAPAGQAYFIIRRSRP